MIPKCLKSDVTFTLEEIERAFMSMAKALGETDKQTLAEGWHAFAVHIIPIGAAKMMKGKK